MEKMLLFAEESNRIEGIHDPLSMSIMAARLAEIIDKPVLTLNDVTGFAKMCGGKLRDKAGMDVRVGLHKPIPGGSEVKEKLEHMIAFTDETGADPYQYHCEFETLHPFTDGNGRTGRMIWAWMMVDKYDYGFELLFLHKFYYQTLAHYRI